MESNLIQLLETLRNRAKQKYDGHYTIMAFTTHFKVFFGTANLYAAHAFAVHEMTPGATLADAIETCLETDQHYCGDENDAAEKRFMAEIESGF